jgi:hypothetical protein
MPWLALEMSAFVLLLFLVLCPHHPSKPMMHMCQALTMCETKRLLEIVFNMPHATLPNFK